MGSGDKSSEALKLGYILFRVNGKYFLDYQRARDYRVTITEGPLAFEAFNIKRGWTGFYYRVAVNGYPMHRAPDLDIRVVG